MCVPQLVGELLDRVADRPECVERLLCAERVELRVRLLSGLLELLDDLLVLRSGLPERGIVGLHVLELGRELLRSLLESLNLW